MDNNKFQKSLKTVKLIRKFAKIRHKFLSKLYVSPKINRRERISFGTQWKETDGCYFLCGETLSLSVRHNGRNTCLIIPVLNNTCIEFYKKYQELLYLLLAIYSSHFCQQLVKMRLQILIGRRLSIFLLSAKINIQFWN